MGPEERKQLLADSYDRYADAIFRYCYVRIRNRDRARDLMQETFLKTWDYLRKGQSVDNIRAFLYTVAHRLIIDDSRKHKEMSLEVLEEGGFEPGKDDARPDIIAIDRLRVALTTINPKYRDVIILRFLDALSIKEIANVLEVSENLVSVRLHNGIKELRTKYPHESFDPPQTPHETS